VKVLALDHGSARTGAAVSDPTGTVVRPLPAILRIDTPAGMEKLAAMVAIEAPTRIVVGDPIGLDGRRGTQSRAAARFARHVAARFEIPVDQLDERLTTVEASRRRRETGAKGDLDSLAACVLLEAYLAGSR
jgi:putative holliday junction resolvase